MWFMPFLTTSKLKTKEKGTHRYIADQQGRVLWRPMSGVKCVHPGYISNFVGWIKVKKEVFNDLNRTSLTSLD